MNQYVKRIDELQKNVILKAILVIFIFIFNMRNISSLDMPAIVGDEFGYWANAATFAGYDWSGLASSLSSYYSYGYGFILAILIKIAPSMQNAYSMAIVLNCILASGAFLLLSLSLENMCLNVDRRLIIISSAMVVMYPSIQHNTQFAWSETVLFSVFSIIACLFAKYVNEKKKKYILLLILGVTYLYMIHQRSIGVFAVTVFFIICISCLDLKAEHKSKANAIKIMLLLCVIIVVGLVIGKYIKDSQQSKLWNNMENVEFLIGNEEEKGSDVNDYSGQLWKIKALFSLSGVYNFLLSFLGKIFYFGLSSFGIGYLGLIKCFHSLYKLIKNRGEGEPYEWWTCYIGMAYMAAVIVSAIYFLVPSRIDTIIYGRYSDWLASPIVLIGFLELMFIANTRKIKWVCLFTVFNEINLLILWYAIKKYDLWFFFGTCSPIGQGFREKMKCDVHWVILMTQVVQLVMIIIFLLSSIKKEKLKRITSVITVSMMWYFITKSAIDYDINMGNKEEMKYLASEINKQHADNIVYYMADDVGEHWHIYSIQFLLGSKPIKVKISNSQQFDEIEDSDDLLIINNDKALLSSLTRFDNVAETENFVIGYCR